VDFFLSRFIGIYEEAGSVNEEEGRRMDILWIKNVCACVVRIKQGRITIEKDEKASLGRSNQCRKFQ